MSYAQVSTSPLDKLLSRSFAQELPRPQPSTALEQAIDPATYLLGPGDILEFNVWGTIEIQQTLMVSPDGVLAIPSVGELRVAGRSLAQTDTLVRRLASAVYPRANLSLHLTDVRRMRVSISGWVVSPGIHSVYAVDRLSALIGLAGGVIPSAEEAKGKENPTVSPLPITKAPPQEKAVEELIGGRERWKVEKLEREPLPSLRRVEIAHYNGAREVIDFLRYQRTGDLKYNPVLQDGDQVHIAVRDQYTDVVHLFGAVKIPGAYEILKGDRIADIIDLAGGFQDGALRSEITLIRSPLNDLSQYQVRSVNWEDGADVELMPNDRIFVRSEFDPLRNAYVKVVGEVKYPGIYPIRANETTLSVLIEACGGVTEDADLNTARVIRWRNTDLYDPEFRRLEEMNSADMTTSEYEYYRTRARDDLPVLVVDFNLLLKEGEKGADILLQDGDEIEVPFLTPTVSVIGQVVRSGLVRYREGASYEYYLRQAGGYGWRAAKGRLRLLKASSGQWVKLNSKSIIEAGDTIFIPEKREVDYWLTFKDFLLVVSQIATIILVVRSF